MHCELTFRFLHTLTKINKYSKNVCIDYISHKLKNVTFV